MNDYQRGWGQGRILPRGSLKKALMVAGHQNVHVLELLQPVVGDGPSHALKTNTSLRVCPLNPLPCDATRVASHEGDQVTTNEGANASMCVNFKSKRALGHFSGGKNSIE